MRIIEDIERYSPFNEQEERDQALIIHALRTEKDVFTRKNALCHVTASAWVVNADRSKVLMVYHNIYNSWSWLGGHADGEEDLLQTAVKEVQEEAGIRHVHPVQNEIYSLEVLTVDGHMKRGAYVSSHLHLNVTYLLEADESEMLHEKADENQGARWFSPEDAVRASTEPWFREHIYSKLNEKLRKIAQKQEEPKCSN